MKQNQGAKWLIIAVVIAGLLIGIWWISQRNNRFDKPEAKRAPKEDFQTQQRALPEQSKVKETKPFTPKPTLSEPGLSETEIIVRVLDEFRSLYQPVGSLDFDAAKELIQKRKARADALAGQLGELGAEGANEILKAYTVATNTREKMFLINALTRNPHPQAVKVLAQLLEEESLFSMEEEIVRSLARHKTSEADDALASIVTKNQNPKLRFVAVQGLSTGPEALPFLVGCVQQDDDLKVRLEAIRSIGLQGSKEAYDALKQFASSDLELRIRQQSIIELARSFPDEAFPILLQLAKAPEEAVRDSTVRGLSLIKSEESTTLLREMAGNDPSASVRKLADNAANARSE